MVKNKFCEVCEAPAIEEYSLRDDESEDSFYCSNDCKHYAHAKGKIYVGAALIVFGLLLLSTIWAISIILFIGGAVAIKIGNDNSKIIIQTGKFARINHNES